MMNKNEQLRVSEQKVGADIKGAEAAPPGKLKKILGEHVSLGLVGDYWQKMADYLERENDEQDREKVKEKAYDRTEGEVRNAVNDEAKHLKIKSVEGLVHVCGLGEEGNEENNEIIEEAKKRHLGNR